MTDKTIQKCCNTAAKHFVIGLMWENDGWCSRVGIRTIHDEFVPIYYCPWCGQEIKWLLEDTI